MDSTAGPVLQAVKKERKRIYWNAILLSPVCTFVFAFVLVFVFFFRNLQSSQAGEGSFSLEILASKFCLWVDGISDHFRDDFEPGSLLFALAALSVAMFLALSTTSSPPETQDTISGRANRMVLDDLSVLVAVCCAVLAWLTLLTLDLADAGSIPDAIAACGTAWLCSATIPLHSVRADVHRLTLLETTGQQSSLEGFWRDLFLRRNSVARWSRMRWSLSYVAWIVSAALIATAFFVLYIRLGGYGFSWGVVAAHLLMVVFMCPWSWVASELFLNLKLDFMLKQYLSICSSIILFFACFITEFLFIYAFLFAMWNSWLALVISGLMLMMPVCLYFLDDRINWFGFLTGMKTRRVRARRLRLQRIVESSREKLQSGTASPGTG